MNFKNKYNLTLNNKLCVFKNIISKVISEKILFLVMRAPLSLNQMKMQHPLLSAKLMRQSIVIIFGTPLDI